jgi:DNA-directed RNA polymerase specialized sigma24 family protein
MSRDDAGPISATAGPERVVLSAELQGEIEAASEELPAAWRDAIVLTGGSACSAAASKCSRSRSSTVTERWPA